MSEIEKEILEIILEHISVCEERFASIEQPSDFVNSSEGNLILDSIAARLQAIGENVKRVIKHYPDFQKKYPEVNWDDIVRFRDFISHHYELLTTKSFSTFAAFIFRCLNLFLRKKRGNKWCHPDNYRDTD